MSKVTGLATGVFLGLIFSYSVMSQPADLIGKNKHMGVASCATSVCHGKLKIQTDENVWLNEYRVWSSEDRHSQAYRTLLSDESKSIANKLGLGSAATAKICLDCHSDNVAKEKRGKKFQITDGVGCESCHGGAEQWITSHAEASATHSSNLNSGLYPLEDVKMRAQLCLSCHMGNSKKLANHEIMGAGHPRIAFELETFTANQPAHYTIDDDYAKRKGVVARYRIWLIGQLASANQYLELLERKISRSNKFFPEIGLYDCQSCHHSMDDKRWTARRTRNGVKPGSLRLQTQHFAGIEAFAGATDTSQSVNELNSLIGELVLSGQTSKEDVKQSVIKLKRWLEEKEVQWLKINIKTTQLVGVRKELLKMAANSKLSDYMSAEQLFLSVDSLSYTIGDTEKHGSALDALYSIVEDDKDFNPAEFESVAKRLLNKF